MGKRKARASDSKGPAAQGATEVDKLKARRADKQTQAGGKTDSRHQKAEGKPMDARFAAAQTDPRFERFPDRRQTLKIDPRFAGILDNPDFQTSAPVDKRGRKVKSTKNRDDISKYYRLQREGGDAPAELDSQPSSVQGRPRKSTKGRSTKGDADELSPPSSDNEDEAAKRWARLRGVGQSSGSSSSSSDDDANGSDDDSSGSEVLRKAREQWGVGALAVNPAEHIPEGDETRRLAAMDLDWDHVRAVDIFAALRSFLPAGGAVKCVTVYPSDYGLERMEQDARSGPQGIFKTGSDSAQRKAWLQKKKRLAGGLLPNEGILAEDFGDSSASSGEGDSDEELEEENGTKESGGDSDESSLDSDASDVEAEQLGDSQAASDTDDSSGADEVDQTQLRMYERSKLRYYYAVIECDSPTTAAKIYAECDGLEFELSACKFDLRFVPDDQNFDGRKVRDSASEVPDGYDPPAFQTQALQHSNVKSTWDADDKDRRRTLVAGRKATKEELRDDDFKAYLAVGSDDSEEEDEEQQARKRALLTEAPIARDSGGNSRGWAAAAEEAAGGGGGGDTRDRGQDMDMEVTFGSGLAHVAQRLTTKKQEHDARKADTVWNQYEQRRREKRAAAKAQGRKNADSDEDYISEPDSPVADANGDGKDFFQSVDDSGFDDPFFKDDPSERDTVAHTRKAPKTKSDRAAAGAEKAAAQEAAAEAARDRAQLELLLMDEDSIRRAAPGPKTEENSTQPPPKLSKKERMRQKKAARVQERTGGSDDEDLGLTKDGFQANLADERFSALFKDDKFALDPTDPRFKASQANIAIQKQRLNHRGSKRTEASTPSAVKPRKGENTHRLQDMVAALKRKSQQSNGTHSELSVKPIKKKRTHDRALIGTK